jgi:hypothetical protein
MAWRAARIGRAIGPRIASGSCAMGSIEGEMRWGRLVAVAVVLGLSALAWLVILTALL